MGSARRDEIGAPPLSRLGIAIASGASGVGIEPGASTGERGVAVLGVKLALLDCLEHRLEVLFLDRIVLHDRERGVAAGVEVPTAPSWGRGARGAKARVDEWRSG